MEPLINTQSGLSENLVENSAVNDKNGSISEKPVPRTGTEPLKSVTPVNSSMSIDNIKPTIPETPPPVPVKSTISRNTDSYSLKQLQTVTRSCFISLPKLTKEDIDMYKSLPPPLSELDTEDEQIISRVKKGMSLRDRKKKDALRPSRAAKRGVSYKDMADSVSDSSGKSQDHPVVHLWSECGPNNS